MNIGIPEITDIPLYSGVSTHRRSYYYKTPLGQVVVYASLQKSNGFVSGEIVAQLPAGYRSHLGHEFPATYGMDSEQKNAGTITIESDGRIHINAVPADNNKAFYFQAVFLATQ